MVIASVYACDFSNENWIHGILGRSLVPMIIITPITYFLFPNFCMRSSLVQWLRHQTRNPEIMSSSPSLITKSTESAWDCSFSALGRTKKYLQWLVQAISWNQPRSKGTCTLKNNLCIQRDTDGQYDNCNVDNDLQWRIGSQDNIFSSAILDLHSATSVEFGLDMFSCITHAHQMQYQTYGRCFPVIPGRDSKAIANME